MVVLKVQQFFIKNNCIEPKKERNKLRSFYFDI